MAASPSPSPTPSASPSPSAPPPTSAYLRVAAGFVDNLPRQIFRTGANKVYLTGALVNTGNIKVYWNPFGGYPTAGSDFSGSATATTSPLSSVFVVDGAYDGGNIIHIFAGDMLGNLKDYPFDTSTNTFKPATTISTGDRTPVSPTDIGTTGVSSMIDSSGKIHIAYWAAGDQIMYRAYTYNSGSNTLTLTDGPTRLDSSITAKNHPELVVSPVDQSITVAWVNGTSGVGTISARSRPSGGAWGSIEAASTGPVWTSSSSGINIDQGPSIVITSDGTKHLIYIENFGSCVADYGRLHYVSKTTAGSWVDQTVSNFCTHAPGIATNSLNEIYVFGHGYPPPDDPGCTSMLDICMIKKNISGTWTNPVTIIAHPGTDSLDASVSVKWSAVGWNAPETLEFALFSANGGSYTNTDIWYGRYAP